MKRASGIDRDKLFVTSKLWNTECGYKKTISAFEKSLSDLGLESLDLYLIHWTANEKQFPNLREINADAWKSFEDLYRQRKIKAIGVSNLLSHHLQALIEDGNIKPIIDQIEYHPGFMQKEVVDYGSVPKRFRKKIDVRKRKY